MHVHIHILDKKLLIFVVKGNFFVIHKQQNRAIIASRLTLWNLGVFQKLDASTQFLQMSFYCTQFECYI